MQQQLKAIVSEQGLGDVVEITGRISAENMPEVYRQNDVLVSASMQEGMSNAMLEAMASGLPIITTRCEGVEELIANNGLVLDQANAREIAGAIRKLADDPQLHRQMSIAARSQSEKFSWNFTAHQYILLYNRSYTKRAKL